MYLFIYLYYLLINSAVMLPSIAKMLGHKCRTQVLTYTFNMVTDLVLLYSCYKICHLFLSVVFVIVFHIPECTISNHFKSGCVSLKLLYYLYLY